MDAIVNAQSAIWTSILRRDNFAPIKMMKHMGVLQSMRATLDNLNDNKYLFVQYQANTADVASAGAPSGSYCIGRTELLAGDDS
jgi:phosphoribosylformylglycinamidine (FGAM) synthase-like amidotransferase family enzyme